MNTKWRKYNKKLLLIFFSFLFIIISFNIIIDPYYIFNTPQIKHINKIKTEKNRNQRITKTVGLKLETKELESIFLGSSRVNESISENYYFKLTKKYTKNLGMNALSHEETYKLANYAILIHPEIKTIYIGLDFFRFLEKNKDNKRDVNLSTKKEITLSEINPLILSASTTIASINTFKNNIFQKNKNKDKKKYFKSKLKQYSKNYNDAKLADNEFKKLQEFKSELEKKGYKVVFYTNPTHVTDLALIKEIGYIDLFNEWKIKLAKNFNYIDFDFVNEITAEDINENTKYFIESSHSNTLMGELIINYLINKSNNIGKDINIKNVHKHNKENELQLQKWEANNKFWSNEIKTIIKNKIIEDKL